LYCPPHCEGAPCDLKRKTRRAWFVQPSSTWPSSRWSCEHFRSGPRTCLPLCGRLDVWKTERTGQSAALMAHRGEMPNSRATHPPCSAHNDRLISSQYRLIFLSQLIVSGERIALFLLGLALHGRVMNDQHAWRRTMTAFGQRAIASRHAASASS
jgi:hypothetical protein